MLSELSLSDFLLECLSSSLFLSQLDPPFLSLDFALVVYQPLAQLSPETRHNVGMSGIEFLLFNEVEVHLPVVPSSQ